jgi:hypothetical protein
LSCKELRFHKTTSLTDKRFSDSGKREKSNMVSNNRLFDGMVLHADGSVILFIRSIYTVIFSYIGQIYTVSFILSYIIWVTIYISKKMSNWISSGSVIINRELYSSEPEPIQLRRLLGS